MLQASTLAFFRELRQNNNKEWFDLNRPRYEKVKKDYQQLVSRILEQMQKHDPNLAHLQVKDCTFRINRDVRFAKDKSPYKTNLGIIITPFGRKLDFAGYYVHIDEEAGSFAGGGLYMPQSDTLKKVRREVADFYEDLEEILQAPSFTKVYGELDREPGTVLSRPPKGFNSDDPAIEYLKMKSYTATAPLDNQWLTDPMGIEKVVAILRELKPLLDFFNRAISFER